MALDSTPGKLGGEDNVALVREDIQAGDKRLIEGVINALIRHLCLVNKVAEVPQFVWVPEAEDEKALIERDKKLWDMGVRFEPSYLQKVYRLDEKSFKVVDPAQALMPPSFSELQGTGTNKYTAPLDAMENGHFKSFYKPFNSYNKRLLTALEKAEYWEDAFAAILQTPLETDGEALRQDLLNAHIIGRGQVLSRIARGMDAEDAARTGRASGRPSSANFADPKATARNWFTKKNRHDGGRFCQARWRA